MSEPGITKDTNEIAQDDTDITNFSKVIFDVNGMFYSKFGKDGIKYTVIDDKHVQFSREDFVKCLDQDDLPINEHFLEQMCDQPVNMANIFYKNCIANDIECAFTDNNCLEFGREAYLKLMNCVGVSDESLDKIIKESRDTSKVSFETFLDA